jgi:hypothetical protein
LGNIDYGYPDPSTSFFGWGFLCAEASFQRSNRAQQKNQDERPNCRFLNSHGQRSGVRHVYGFPACRPVGEQERNLLFLLGRMQNKIPEFVLWDRLRRGRVQVKKYSSRMVLESIGRQIGAGYFSLLKT